MIAISKATYNPKVNAVREKRVRTFDRWDEQIMDYFKYLIKKGKSVYIWGQTNDIMLTIAVSHNYLTEWHKIID